MILDLALTGLKAVNKKTPFFISALHIKKMRWCQTFSKCRTPFATQNIKRLIRISHQHPSQKPLQINDLSQRNPKNL